MSLPSRSRVVALAAERLAEVYNANRKLWQRERHPMDFVPFVREVVGILLYDGEVNDELIAALRDTDPEETP